MNSSGQLLERIDNYNLMQTILNQCSDRARLHEDELWISEGFIANSQEIGTNAASNMYRIGANGTDTTREYAHKMHGAWFQSTKKKLLPPGIAFRLEIELVDSANACMTQTNGGTVNNFSISNVSLVVPTVQIMSQAFEDSTSRMLSRGYRWIGATYRSYDFSVANASAEQTLIVPDKSLALTGLIALSRRSTDLTANNTYKNYCREGNAFRTDYNVTIGSQAYPPVKIKYEGAAANVPLSQADTGYKLAEAVQQMKAVLGGTPYAALSGEVGGGPGLYPAVNFTKTAEHNGVGFLCVQVGYGQGIGIDTQTPSLPVTFKCFTNDLTGGGNQTISIFCQATATFSMQPEQGMLTVRSFI